MKKVFVQLWKWVLKYRKNIIYGALVLFAVQICFFDIWWIWLDNEVFAQTTETASQSESFENIVTRKVNLFSFIEKAIYVLLYPLMFLAGKLADNSLVYGEIFWFDAVLWNLWNFVRNLANFWLWFIFVYKIFEYLVKWQKSWDMKKILVSSLIAWIWIQASWFLMAALIDVSTILTYWVWWLPISVLWSDVTSNSWEWDQNKEWFNPYIFKTLVSVDTNDFSDLSVYQTNISSGTSGIYISECRTFPYKKDGIDETLILAPKMIYYYQDDNHIYPTADNVCHLYGQVYWFKSLASSIQTMKIKTSSDKKAWFDAQKSYDAAWTDLISQMTWPTEVDMTWAVVGCSILEIWNAHVEGWVRANNNFNIVLTWEECWLDVENKWIWSGTTIKMKELMSRNTTNSYVWVFTSLYSSLLNAGDSIIVQRTDSGAYEKFLWALLTLGHMIAIAIPLIVVVFLFMMRIWIIWIAIALSPIIVLLSAFGLFSSKVIKGVKFLEYFELKNLIWIIFAPAVICFAISMSTVLVKVIERINTSKINTEPLVLWWLVQINLAWFTVWLWQLIIAVMWVAITWFLVWAAVRSSKLWEEGGVIDKLYKLANSAIWSVPIVPIPWKWWQWVDLIWANTAFGLNGQQWLVSSLVNKWKDEYETEDEKTLNQLLNPEAAAAEAAETAQKIVESNKVQEYSTGLVSLTLDQIWSDWISRPIWEGKISFTSLNEWEKEKVINQINNIQDAGKKDRFGTGATELKVWSKIYRYDVNEHMYKAEESGQTS